MGSFIMDILTGIGSGVANSVLSNPAMQAMIMGVVVKVVVDRLKQFTKEFDANGVPADKRKQVQLLVMVCSFIATVAELALNGSLSTLDPTKAVSFVANWALTMLTANGAHEAGKVLPKKGK
jgi:hypothetical protein